MKKEVNWGILGCGRIAQKFIEDLKMVAGANCIAAASRDQERANSFATINQIPKAYSSYEALVLDEDVDVVYIATRNHQHHQNTMLAINHGKAVLCEKPLALNQSQVKEMLERSKSKNVFLMEALWTRFLPATIKAKEIIDSGNLGDIIHIYADFGFIADSDKVRLFSKTQGGGSLLDIGIYPIFLAQLFFGAPKRIEAQAELTEVGVDMSCGMCFHYQNGQQAMLHSTLKANTQNQAWIHGTKASLLIHPRFHESEQISIYKNLKRVDDLFLNKEGHGYSHEIQHVHDCLQKGLIESPLWSHEDSLLLSKTIDSVKSKIGLSFVD